MKVKTAKGGKEDGENIPDIQEEEISSSFSGRWVWVVLLQFEGQNS